ncbi:response regulator [Fulvimarina endophytica]|uniref:Response regulator n=1 Tax=Fulvimarina endophytica TaxID=2293836 RepID=A0A371X7K4_9HYPH|nr:response regulator [Fulvimarina endophytica]
MKRQSPSAARSLNGLSVVVVEDETIIAMQLEDMLEDAGCRIVATAMRLRQAMALLDEDKAAGAAVLDVNLGDATVFPFAEGLQAAGIPIVFATGYGTAGVPDEWRRYPILQKPYTSAQIEAALLRVVFDERREDAGQVAAIRADRAD